MAGVDVSIGLSGLSVAQRALQTIGHNIANANTEGYSRQSISIESRIPDSSPAGPVGTGVTVSKITRMKNDLLDSQISSQTSLLGSTEIQSNTLQNLQVVLDELSENGVGGILKEFFSSLQGLSTNPELTSSRFQVLESAKNLSDKFNILSNALGNIQHDVSQQISTKVTEMNNLTKQIASLNKEIAAIELDGVNANDLRDKRTFLVNNLSKLGDVRITEKVDGSIDVTLGGTLLVNQQTSEKITTSLTGQNKTRINGIVNIVSGELRGLLDLQDVTLPKYIQKLDTLASSIIKEINNIHSEGVGLGGGFTSLTSTNPVNGPTEQLDDTGLPFDPSVTTYTTGTITSTDNGDGTTTVTGTGTSFANNVNPTDFIKLNDGNFYKITSVVSDTSLIVSGTYTDATSIPTNTTNGNLYVTITNDSTGEITKTGISIASDETLNSLTTKLDGITSLNASVSNNLLTITADSGYKYSFTKALDINPGDIGNSTVSLSGHYNGNDNDIYTMTVQDAGSGSIGTGSAVIRVTDASGTVLADLDVGSSYTAGNVLQIADGISVSFGSGSIAVGQKQNFDVVNDPDTGNVLTALGINTFFRGNSASSIGVTQYVKDDVARIAAATTDSPGDNTNVLRLIDLQSSKKTDQTTFDDFLNGTVAELGMETSQKMSEREGTEIVLLSLDNRRQEISGVSIEEEMVNIIRFQQAFQASARFISTIKEINDVLLSLK